MEKPIDPLKETKEEKEKFFSKSYHIGLAISFAGTLIMGVIIFFIRYYGGINGNRRLILSLVDGFGIAGLLSVLFFLILWVSNYGAFDAISYSVQFVWNMMFHKKTREARLPKNYFEYRELKRGKKRANTTFMLFPGLLFLIIGIILMIIYF